MRFWLGCALIGAILPASISAQTRPKIDVTAFEMPGRADLMRPPHAATDPEKWLTAADLAAIAMLAPRGTASIFFEVRVMVDGKDMVTNCSAATTDIPAERAATLCSLIVKRATFRHALAADGSTPETAVIVRFQLELAGRERPMLPSMPGGAELTPTPTPKPSAASLRRPYSPTEGVLVGGPRDTVTPPMPVNPNDLILPGFGAVPSPLVEVQVDQDGLATNCRIVATSGSDAFDLAACRHAETIRFLPARSPNETPQPATTTIEFNVGP